jgi:hypothetical protein
MKLHMYCSEDETGTQIHVDEGEMAALICAVSLAKEYWQGNF